MHRVNSVTWPRISFGDEVVTFVARDLESVRGFALLMRALPELLRLRPTAHIVICRGDGVSYGRPPAGGGSWKDRLLREHPHEPGRVHFVGKLARADYIRLLQVSALHLYLSLPFVLSWSCVEAMAAGCLLLASDVAPVREVLTEGETAFLVDARDADLLARRAADLLARRAALNVIRSAAREQAVARFDARQCLAAQTLLISGMMQ